MFHVPWLHFKYTLNVVQNILTYIKCVSTPQKVMKLQPNLWLNEHSMKKLKKLIDNKGCII